MSGFSQSEQEKFRRKMAELQSEEEKNLYAIKKLAMLREEDRFKGAEQLGLKLDPKTTEYTQPLLMAANEHAERSKGSAIPRLAGIIAGVITLAIIGPVAPLLGIAALVGAGGVGHLMSKSQENKDDNLSRLRMRDPGSFYMINHAGKIDSDFLSKRMGPGIDNKFLNQYTKEKGLTPLKGPVQSGVVTPLEGMTGQQGMAMMQNTFSTVTPNVTHQLGLQNGHRMVLDQVLKAQEAPLPVRPVAPKATQSAPAQAKNPFMMEMPKLEMGKPR